MFMKWLKENQYAAILLTLVRVYLGYSWLTAGYHKIADGFDATGFLKRAATLAQGDHPAVQGWWAAFLDGFAVPNAGLFNFLIPWGEFLVGLGLLLGCLTTAAAYFGLVMNFAFLFSGTTSTNPQMVLLTILILLAGYNARKYGLDPYVTPYIQKKFKAKK